MQRKTTLHTCSVHDLVVADLVHELEALQGLLDRHTDERLRERAGPVRRVEEEKALALVHAQQRGDILVVWQRGGQAHHAHELRCRLHLAQRPAAMAHNIKRITYIKLYAYQHI